MMSLSNKPSTARCTFEAEPSPYRRTNSPAKTFTPADSPASPFKNRFYGMVSDSHSVV